MQSEMPEEHSGNLSLLQNDLLKPSRGHVIPTAEEGTSVKTVNLNDQVWLYHSVFTPQQPLV